MPSQSGPGAVQDDVLVSQLTSFEDLSAASDLYQKVFGYVGRPLNLHLIAAMSLHGGTTIGAKTPDGRLVGFGYGFTGLQPGGRPYHYSQAVVVDPTVQSKGVGRRIKAAQRDVCLRLGLTSMHWTFDPLFARNAHFNLDSLGATGRWMHRDYYGYAGSDRLEVEWDLRRDPAAPRRRRLPGAQPLPTEDFAATLWGSIVQTQSGPIVPIPSTVVAGDARSPEERAASTRLAGALQELLADGWVAVSCERIRQTAAYRFARSQGSA